MDSSIDMGAGESPSSALSECELPDVVAAPPQHQLAQMRPLPQGDTVCTGPESLPAPGQSCNPDPPGGSQPRSSSRATILAFLLFVGVAITHAVASGFQHMHEPKKIQQPEGFGNDRSQTRSVSANSSRENAATASILSRASQLSSLISHLDASDVVECYVVTRMAHLTNVASTSTGGGGNRRVQRMLDESMASSDSDDDAESKAEDGTSATHKIPSGPVVIRKSALAFRYRPRVASASRGHSLATDEALDELSPEDKLEEQKYFELTLEYGPQRTGATKIAESLPVVRMDMELMGSSNGDVGKFVQWENEGRVYYNTRISNEWTEAYYMAAITGVVLEKIIQRAVEYTYKRPRYQPFEVVSIPSRNLILKSSGSDDFVWDMFRDLADLYVDIDPLLVPPRGMVQFYVSDPEEAGEDNGEGDGRRESGDGDGAGDVSNAGSPNRSKRKHPNPNVKQVKGQLEGARAAVFYENFFNCANAIKTGDYSLYLPPPSPAPTLSPTTTAPSMAPSTTDEDVDDKSDLEGDENKEDEVVEEEGDVADSNHDENEHVEVVQSSDIVNDGENHTVEETGDDHSNNRGSVRRNLSSLGNNSRRRLEEDIDNAADESQLDAPEKEPEINPEDATVGDEGGDDIEEDDDIPGLSLDGDDALDDFIGIDPGDSEDDPAEVAEKAAIEAAKAAENAAAVVATNSSTPADTSEVIAATNEAAKAAIKAKDASVAARAKISAEALLSGDGDQMTSVLSTCFSDSKYGIRKQEEVQHEADYEGEEDSGRVIEKRESTFAYIYLDGDVFIRLNLAAPYWGTHSALETVPPPHVPPEGKGDTTDWAIFILILSGTLFGFLVMVHQVGIVCDKRLRFRWLFHPTMTEEDWATDEDFGGGEDEQSPLKGGGFLHSELRMTPESIPTSMGGSKKRSPPTIYRDDPAPLAGIDESSGGLDLEMAERRSSHPDESATTPSPRKGSFADEPLSLRMKRDTPDLVERKSNVSFSKVAMPRTSPVSQDLEYKRKLAFKKSSSPPALPLSDP